MRPGLRKAGAAQEIWSTMHENVSMGHSYLGNPVLLYGYIASVHPVEPCSRVPL